jgi:hypothetical protein
MKKFLTTIQGWWLLKFRNTIVQEIEFDAYKVTFRRFTMDIETKSGNMKLRMTHCEHPNAFLFSCLEDNPKLIEMYCRRLYEFVNFYTFDVGFANEYAKAINKFYKRMEKKTESLAKDISDDDDQIAIEIVKSNIEYAKMNNKERKVHKNTIKEILTEKDNG